MTTRHLLPIAIAGIIIAILTGATAALAQPAGGGTAAGAPAAAKKPLFELPSFLIPPFFKPPAKPHPEARPSDPASMTFYVATGPAGACGPGCSAWIAAEGRIDINAAQRLRKVLAKLGPRKLPLYLHSAGGSVLGAIELGRLVRRHDLTVSIARTTPAACPNSDARDNKGCETLKRSGRDLASDFDPTSAICNSACVLVLAGGARRSVPPWVKLGVHAIGIDAGKTAVRGPLVAAATRAANARIVEYLRDMGIPKALFDASNAVPHESTRFLERDELVRFGLDSREFGETGWRFAEKPGAAIAKGFFVHTGGAGLAYPEALLRLSCGAGGKSMRLTFARERLTSAAGAAGKVLLTVNGMGIELPGVTRSGKIEVRTTPLWPDAIAFAASADDGSSIEISGFDAGERGKRPGGETADSKPKDDGALKENVKDGTTENGAQDSRIVLNMAGFSAAYARLQKACGEIASADTRCSAGDASPRCMPAAHKIPPASTGSKAARPSQ